MSATKSNGLELTAFGLTVAAISFLVTSEARRHRRRAAAMTTTANNRNPTAAPAALTLTTVKAPALKRSDFTPYAPLIKYMALLVGISFFLAAAVRIVIPLAQAAHHIG